MKIKQITYPLLILIILFITSCEWPQNSPPVKPDGYISRALADTLENNYVEFIHNRNRNDHREFWFSIEEMEKIVNHTKHVADSMNATNVGIRAYLGARQNASGQWRTELFFMPTGTTSINKLSRKSSAESSSNNNLLGTGGYNHSQSGMPPINLINP